MRKPPPPQHGSVQWRFDFDDRITRISVQVGNRLICVPERTQKGHVKSAPMRELFSQILALKLAPGEKVVLRRQPPQGDRSWERFLATMFYKEKYLPEREEVCWLLEEALSTKTVTAQNTARLRDFFAAYGGLAIADAPRLPELWTQLAHAALEHPALWDLMAVIGHALHGKDAGRPMELTPVEKAKRKAQAASYAHAVQRLWRKYTQWKPQFAGSAVSAYRQTAHYFLDTSRRSPEQKRSIIEIFTSKVDHEKGLSPAQVGEIQHTRETLLRRFGL